MSLPIQEVNKISKLYIMSRCSNSHPSQQLKQVACGHVIWLKQWSSSKQKYAYDIHCHAISQHRPNLTEQSPRSLESWHMWGADMWWGIWSQYEYMCTYIHRFTNNTCSMRFEIRCLRHVKAWLNFAWYGEIMIIHVCHWFTEVTSRLQCIVPMSFACFCNSWWNWNSCLESAK